jgi:cephalosporin hydroxylase
VTPAHGRRQLFCHGPPFFAVPITGKVRAAGAARQSVIVQNTLIEDLPADLWPDRPWAPGNSPKTAVKEFLRGTDRFEVDRHIENKLLLTACPGGYPQCIKD